MVEMREKLIEVKERDGYLVEIGYPDELGRDDKIITVLNTYIDEIGKSIGDGKEYVRPLGPDASRNFLNHLDRQPDVDTMPWLVLLSKHSDEVEPGEEVLTLQLGKLDDKDEVIATVRGAVEALNDEEFMKNSSPSQRAEIMRRALPYMTKENALTESDETRRGRSSQ